MRTDLFDFDLPDDSIALTPRARGTAPASLSVRPRPAEASLSDAGVRDLPNFPSPRRRARVQQHARHSGGARWPAHAQEITSRVSFNLTRRVADDRWRALARRRNASS